jgi:hypothetical protein
MIIYIYIYCTIVIIVGVIANLIEGEKKNITSN